ncbi:MAG: ABC transporter substrate-binding protein [Deltaproteobacteria bacterium]|nr:MAG: ABC transporter substrate-binding protein [Deltaproteobacteria bacterium]
MKFRVATRCSKLLCLGLWGYLILCLGFTRTAVSSAAERVRLAVPTVAVMYAPIYLGIHQGIFAAEGMELEISSMRTDLAIAALGTGDLDYIAHGGAALRAAAQGFPLKLVFALDHKAPFWLVARPEIENLNMLRGKKIGISFPGDTPQLVLKRFLRRKGIDPDREVSYVAGQFSPTALQSLLGGALDGAVLAPPFNVLAEEKGLRVLSFLGEAVPDATTSNGIVTSDRKIKSQPDQVRRMVRANLTALLAFRQKKGAAVDLLVSQFNISKKTAEKVYAHALEILTPDGELSHEKLRNILDMMQETGKKDLLAFQPEALLDFSFLREARKELGQSGEGKNR